MATAIVARMPDFLHRILVVADAATSIFELLRDRGFDAHPMIENDPAGSTPPFDAVLCAPTDAAGLSERLGKARGMLNSDGMFLVAVLDNAAIKNVRDLSDCGSASVQDVQSAASDVNYVTYLDWPLEISIEERATCVGRLVALVQANYSPLLHARRMLGAGRLGHAFEVLSCVPIELLSSPDIAAAVAAEKQLCLLAWDKIAEPSERLARIFNAQAFFYEAVAAAPHLPEPYVFQAEFWNRLNGSDMSLRLLRSLKHASPEMPLDDFMARFEAGPALVRSVPPIPSYDNNFKPSILYFIHPRPHFGLDVLYDGLCEVLGAENVCEFPYKPSLHGEPPTELSHYPCAFNRPGVAKSIEDIERLVRDSAFDLVLFGDIEGAVSTETVRHLIDLMPDLPVFVVDAQDDPVDHRSIIEQSLGAGRIRGYFKREMLRYHDYGPDAFPLPFAYPEHRIPPTVSYERTQPLFWAGHRRFGLRRLYLEHIERRFGLRLDEEFDQDSYANMLQRSKIGLNIFGFGFDTVRYWELPAHGCMLLAERMPIHIPNNFEDAVSAVFFDHLGDLESKLEYYLESPDEAAVIARNGTEHLKRFHTGAARARQLLAICGVD